MTARDPKSFGRRSGVDGIASHASRPLDQKATFRPMLASSTPVPEDLAGSRGDGLAQYVAAASDETVLSVPCVSSKPASGVDSFMARCVIAREYALRSTLWDQIRDTSLHASARGELYIRNHGVLLKVDKVREYVILTSACDDDPGALSYLGKPSLEVMHAARLHDSGLNFVFALPGMGKTTVAAADAGLLDLDYGNWRRSYGESKDHLSLSRYMNQLSLFMDYVAAEVHLKRHSVAGPLTVLLNEIDLLPWVGALGYKAIVVLPQAKFVDEWLEGLRRRERVNPTPREGRYASFAAKAEDRWFNWLCDWTSAAHAAGVRVIELDTWMTADLVKASFPAASPTGPARDKAGPDCGTESHYKEE